MPLKEGFYIVFGRWKMPGAEHEYAYMYWDGMRWKLPKILRGIEFVVKKWGEVDFNKITALDLSDCYLIPEDMYSALEKMVTIGCVYATKTLEQI